LAISKKYAVHQNFLNIFRTTPQDARYYIQLGTVVTTQYYGDTIKEKIFGTGQGSDCSPHIWILLSSELFTLYTENAQGSQFITPYGDHITSLYLTAYVDDVNTHHSFTSQNTILQMIYKTSNKAQKWNDILHVSGGKLSSS
jgi:hypothetical protein